MSAELDKQEIDTTFRFHHVCWIVSDMDRAIYLWRDVLGFTLLSDSPSPTADDGTNMWPGGMEEMDDITDMENYRFRAVVFDMEPMVLPLSCINQLIPQ